MVEGAPESAIVQPHLQRRQCRWSVSSLSLSLSISHGSSTMDVATALAVHTLSSSARRRSTSASLAGTVRALTATSGALSCYQRDLCLSKAYSHLIKTLSSTRVDCFLQFHDGPRSHCDSFVLCIGNESIQSIQFEDDVPLLDDLLKLVLMPTNKDLLVRSQRVGPAQGTLH